MNVDTSSIFRLPKMSEREAAGRLISIPGIVEAAATKPMSSGGVPRLVAKGFSTGFFDIVELRIASAPMLHTIRKLPSTDFRRNMGFAPRFYSFMLISISAPLPASWLEYLPEFLT